MFAMALIKIEDPHLSFMLVRLPSSDVSSDSAKGRIAYTARDTTNKIVFESSFPKADFLPLHHSKNSDYFIHKIAQRFRKKPKKTRRIATEVGGFCKVITYYEKRHYRIDFSHNDEK